MKKGMSVCVVLVLLTGFSACSKTPKNGDLGLGDPSGTSGQEEQTGIEDDSLGAADGETGKPDGIEGSNKNSEKINQFGQSTFGEATFE